MATRKRIIIGLDGTDRIEEYTPTTEELAQQQAEADRQETERENLRIYLTQLMSAKGALDRFPEGPVGVSQAIDKLVSVVDYLRLKFPEDVL